MHLQEQIDDFMVIPTVWTGYLEKDFMEAYSTLLTQYPHQVPNLDDTFDRIEEFFYETVSFYEFSGDSTAHHHLDTTEARDSYYETAREQYFWRFYVDLKTFVDTRKICTFVPGVEYVHMPIKEVW